MKKVWRVNNFYVLSNYDKPKNLTNAKNACHAGKWNCYAQKQQKYNNNRMAMKPISTLRVSGFRGVSYCYIHVAAPQLTK